MRKSRELWRGILVGFGFTLVLTGFLFTVWQLKNKRDEDAMTPMPTITPSASEHKVEVDANVEDTVMNSGWNGNWNRVGDTQFEHSSVYITSSKKGQIDFIINAFSGDNFGVIEGSAELLGDQCSYINSDEGYTVSFTLHEEQLQIEMTGNTQSSLGFGVTVDGIYKLGEQMKQMTDFVELGIFDNTDELDSFKQLVKEDYQLFADSFQLCSISEDRDGFKAKVLTGTVRGTIDRAEGIIMKGADQNIWAAVIHENKIKYYTTGPNEYLPITIDHWRQDFEKLEVVSADSGETVQRLTLEEIKNRDQFRQMKEHSFQIKLEKLGKVDFVAGILTENGRKKAEYYLVNKDEEVVYKFPTANNGTFVRTRAVSFRNIDMIKPEYTKDIIIVEEFTDVDSEFSDVVFPYCRIYTEREYGFEYRTDLCDELNQSGRNENILVILEYIKDIKYRKEFLDDNATEILAEKKVSLEMYPDAKLVAANAVKKGKKQLKILLVLEGNYIGYEFYVPDKETIGTIREMEVVDINGDGKKDVIILADDKKEKGNQFAPVCFIYIRGGNEYLYLSDANKKINNSGKLGSISQVIEYCKDRTFKMTVDDLTEQGMKLYKNHTYPIDTEGLGKVNLVLGQKKGLGVNSISLYLVDKIGTILRKVPELPLRDCNSINKVEFRDVNGDGMKDIILLVNYTTGFGTNGVSPSPYCHILLQSTEDFKNIPELDQKINYYVDDMSTKTVIDFLKKIM